MTVPSSPWAKPTALLVGTLLLLTACAGTEDSEDNDDDGDTSDSQTGEGLVPEAEGNVEYPLSIDTVHGEIELQQRPERIAVVGWNPNHDAAASLGVTPVYASSRSFEYGWMDDQWLENIETLEEREDADLNVEGIAASDPDLIFVPNTAEWFEDEEIERLSEIAPVLEHDEIVPGDQVDWRDAPELLGQALDLSEAAAEVIAEAEQSIEDTAADHPEFEGTSLTLATDYGEEYGIEYYNTPGGTAEEIVNMLGFETPSGAEAYAEDASVSEENQADLDADILIMFYAEESIQEGRESSELFQQIPAVQEGRYVPVLATEDERAEAGAIWVLRRGASAKSLPWMLDALADWANEAGLEG
ncbi:ABC transporter substrate-binding protein [Nesterenkonia alba]|uniref:ABC transporter substrate-binding protein n=1 Tax=Nesterenkonia alba TaxID=515814 RepID=UPI0003B7260D|nr:ABC transporter substrate-binding protein [Nesterenkonia alba]